MGALRKDHFQRAAADIGAHGDNDTLPFDVDNKFIKERSTELAQIAYNLGAEIAKGSRKSARNMIDSATIFSERLLSPSGPGGFRIVTKIHPFWTIYYNGLGIAVAETLEPFRSDRVHSYRFNSTGVELFDRRSSWKAYKLETLERLDTSHGFVVQTDVSSFYDHIYHHRLENCLSDLFPSDETIPVQVDRILNRIATGRSFGLPVGAQGSRIFAEALLSMVDSQLDDTGIDWSRYVDDFVLIAPTAAASYRALAILSNALADYGLALNRAKTTIMSARHYAEYVRAQLGMDDLEGQRLHEIDLQFDPYSDDPQSDFEELQEIVNGLDISKLLNLELAKSHPDTFLVSQISRTLRLHTPEAAHDLCKILLSKKTLHGFRASWSKIMRGITAVRADESFESVHSKLDELIDAIPSHSPHLLLADSSILHYLRAIRFSRSSTRSSYVRKLFDESKPLTLKRACIDCWRHWKDRPSFTRLRSQWNQMSPEEQRMLWLAASDFGDEGEKFKSQVKRSIETSWKIGTERTRKPTFAAEFIKWSSR